MPNHVHVLFVPHPNWTLEQLVHSWKRFSAVRINHLLGSKGELWQRDYFDRMIRNEEHLGKVIRYLRRNPEKGRVPEGAFILWEGELARQWE